MTVRPSPAYAPLGYSCRIAFFLVIAVISMHVPLLFEHREFATNVLLSVTNDGGFLQTKRLRLDLRRLNAERHKVVANRNRANFTETVAIR